MGPVAASAIQEVALVAPQTTLQDYLTHYNDNSAAITWGISGFGHQNPRSSHSSFRYESDLI